MKELLRAEFGALPALDQVSLFTGFVPMVLDGRAEGRVWCEAGAAHALHSYGMSLVWGAGVGASFAALIEHLNTGVYRAGDEWLQVDPAWDLLDWDGQLQAERFGRVNFRFDPAAFAAHHGEPVLPPGWKLVSLGETAFDLPDVHVTPKAFWTRYDAFIANGGGVAAVKDGEVGAIAFTATAGAGWREIGIETRAQFRGLGLARAVAVGAIHNYLAAGLTPVWACRKENAGSLHLAQSVGFAVTQVVPFWRLPVNR